VSSAHIWWFVSDLHLDTGPDRRGTASALVDFLGVIGETRPEADRSIVLLGDSFNLPYDDTAAATLSDIARRHSDVFAALRRARGAGVDVDVVCGNHDTALARPAVSDTLEQLLSADAVAWPAPAHGVVRVHPWWLHQPQVFYAEHGHQHHDVHRVPTLLEQTVSSPPTYSLLTAWTSATGTGPVRQLRAVTRAVVATRAAERRATGAPYLALVDEQASRAALPVPAAHALACASRFRTAAAAVGASRRVLARRVKVGARGPMLRQAAERVHSALELHGATVPAVIFGHTHRAERQAIAGTSAFYLNTGTWSDDVRGGGPDRGDDQLFPYIRVDALDVDGVVTAHASLRYWGRCGDREKPSEGPSAKEPVQPA
jgi:UDP-2,3-diacylglucosamine pyrophosphatase LpxH